MIDHERLLALIESFTRINNKYNAVDSQPMDCGTDGVIYSSEIHLLNTAEKHRGENITELGNYLGITKSAASQTVSKLVNKGLCRKIKPDNEKNVSLELTSKGESAVRAFREYKQTVFADLIHTYESSSDEKLKIIEELFLNIEELMDRMLEKK